MRATRRRILGAMAALPAAWSVSAQENTPLPNRPLRLLAGSVPGTLVDHAARLYADKMAAFLKQPVVVENVAGASSLLAVRQLLKAPADGTTLLAAANTIVTVPHVNAKAGYAVKDLAALGEMVRSPVLLAVRGAAPYRTLAEFLDAARKRPGELTYGSSGVATTNHLAVELLARSAGVKFSHIPYKGIAAAVPDVVAGRVDFMMGTATSIVGLMKTGALRALAISSDRRSPQFPDVPTLREAGHPDATFEIWIGIVGAAGIPRVARARLGEAMEAARNDAGVVRDLQAAGQEISAVRTPEQFDAVLKADEERLRRVIREANISAE